MKTNEEAKNEKIVMQLFPLKELPSPKTSPILIKGKWNKELII